MSRFPPTYLITTRYNPHGDIRIENPIYPTLIKVSPFSPFLLMWAGFEISTADFYFRCQVGFLLSARALVNNSPISIYTDFCVFIFGPVNRLVFGGILRKISRSQFPPRGIFSTHILIIRQGGIIKIIFSKYWIFVFLVRIFTRLRQSDLVKCSAHLLF